MAQLAKDIERLPIPDPVNKPQSGTYGEQADTERLKSSLPATQPPTPGGEGPPGGPAPPGGQAQPVNPIRSNREARNLPGVPAPMLEPTTRPSEPVNTPRQAVPTGAVNPAQRRLAVLDTLANSSEVSAETREWAEMVMRVLLGN